MTTWAEIKKGDRVELSGKPFTVTKLKAKGKRAKLTVSGAAGTFSTEVKLKDKVTRAPEKASRGRQSGGDWYKPTKAEAKEQRRQLAPGDPKMTKPPRVDLPAPWDKPADRAEKMLDKMLGAHLVGQSLDEGGGYYVPPQDVTTIAAHWMIFHEGDQWQDEAPAKLLELHATEHAAVVSEAGWALKVNHWHTNERPKP